MQNGGFARLGSVFAYEHVRFQCWYLRTMARNRGMTGDPGGVSVCCCGVCLTVIVCRKSCGPEI